MSHTFFPLPSTYAVVEIDVEKTLQSLHDPIADAAAATMRTTKCIVFLGSVRACLPSRVESI